MKGSFAVMDAITTGVFIDNVFLLLQRRNIPGISMEDLRLAGREFQELCRDKDVKTDIRLSEDEFDDLLASSNVVELQSGTPSTIRVKSGAVLGRRYMEYLPLRATVVLVIDLPKIIERICATASNEAPQKSA